MKFCAYMLWQRKQIYYNVLFALLNTVQANCRSHISTHNTLPLNLLFDNLKQLELHLAKEQIISFILKENV